MKRIRIILLVLAAAICLLGVSAQAEQEKTLLTIYEGPKTMETSRTAEVRVNGYDLFVYDVMVNHEHIWNANTQPSSTPMTYFDLQGTARMEIRMPGLEREVESAVVMPASAGIEPEVSEGTVRFSVTQPGQYTVVFNGDVNKALHIFVNPIEENAPDPEDPNVYYIGPGEWVMDAIALHDGETLYIAGGAVLHSIISVAGAKDVRIGAHQPGSFEERYGGGRDRRQLQLLERQFLFLQGCDHEQCEGDLRPAERGRIHLPVLHKPHRDQLLRPNLGRQPGDQELFRLHEGNYLPELPDLDGPGPVHGDRI